MSTPDSFKGAVLVQTGEGLRIYDGISAPSLRYGQVLVKIQYAGLCHSQLMEVRGMRGPDRYLPHFLGHEGVGHVCEVGSGVTKVAPGDEVILGWIKAEGQEGGPTQYKGPEGQIINSGAVTTFSEYSIVSENRLVLKPPHTPADLSVLYGCALPTGAGLVFNELKPKSDSAVVVLGLGGIGISALLALREFHPKCLIAVDIEDDKLALAKEMGASHCIKADAADLIEQVKVITGPEGADYCVEAAGLVKTIQLGFKLIRKGGGELIFVSHPKAGDLIELDPFELICGKSIRGSWGGGSRPDHDIPLLDKMYGEGKLQLDKLLSHRFKLEEINNALQQLEDRKIVRALIEIAPEL